MKHCEVKRLSENQKNNIEGSLKYNEVAETLKNMKNDKSPGSEGLTSNFYKMFLGKIDHFIVNVLNYAFIHNSFSPIIKLGTIACIPKENKNLNIF